MIELSIDLSHLTLLIKYDEFPVLTSFENSKRYNSIQNYEYCNGQSHGEFRVPSHTVGGFSSALRPTAIANAIAAGRPPRNSNDNAQTYFTFLVQKNTKP